MAERTLAPDNNSDEPCPLPGKKTSKSFWHSEPDEFLLGHRTTSELPARTQVVVVGCGISGSNAARYLVESGAFKARDDVVVLDAREVCWGATGRNGGHCQPLLFDSPTEVSRFELANCVAVKEYIEKNDVTCEYRHVSGCRTFWTEPSLAKAAAAVDELQRLDPVTGSKVELLTNPNVLAKHRVGNKCPGATLTAGAGSLWPYKLVAHITKGLVQAGKINLQTNTPVNKITPVKDGKGRWTLHTPRGEVVTEHVILATNGYTSHLLPNFTSLIVPCRGVVNALIPPVQEKGKEQLLPDSYGMKCYSPTATAGADDYLIQRPYTNVPNPKGHFIFGGGKNAGKLPIFGANAADDSIVDPDTAKYLQKSLLDMLNLPGKTEGVTALEADYSWSGIMGFSRDVCPWVGQIPASQEGLFLCGGYTGHGMPNAMLCAKAVADMVVAVRQGQDLEEFQGQLVEEERIPRLYLVSEKRIEEAMALPSVQVQEATDCMDFVDGKYVDVGKGQSVKGKL